MSMATLSMFFGIIIKMYKEREGRHHRPHIHAQHADKAASFDLETSEILAGEMDKDDVDRVRGWMSIHREELFANWKLLPFSFIQTQLYRYKSMRLEISLVVKG